MKESVLFMSISDQIHSFIRIYDKNRRLIQTYTNRYDLNDAGLNNEGFLNCLLENAGEPRLCTVNKTLSYVTLAIDDRICLIGPVSACVDSVTDYYFENLAIPDDLAAHLYPSGSISIIRIAVFLYNLFAETPVDLLACYSRNCIGTDLFEPSMTKTTEMLFYHEEYGDQHNPYDQEKRQMGAITEGNKELLKKSWEEDFSGKIGTLSDNSIRNAKYLCIVVIALSARAAIEGGLPYEVAFSLSDSYCQEIDRLSEDNMVQLETIMHNIQLTFTELVAQRKGSIQIDDGDSSPVYTRAKNYIFSHLHERLTVEDIADALGMHPVYLNRVFKQACGMTIHEHILNEKISFCKNMLMYSDQSLLEIAIYLGFSSQSHLGNTFKKATGMTLKKYRDKYRGIN